MTEAGKTQEVHDLNVKLFLKAVRRHNFKNSKSVNNIQILGSVAEKGVIKPDPKKLRPLKDFPPPSNFIILRSALGMFAYYAKWINRFAGKIHPVANSKVLIRTEMFRLFGC